MKKLKLKAFELSADGVLTREQLKNTLAGVLSGGDCPDNSCSYYIACETGYKCTVDRCPRDENFLYTHCVSSDDE